MKCIKYWLRRYKLNRITMQILKEIKVSTGEIGKKPTSSYKEVIF